MREGLAFDDGVLDRFFLTAFLGGFGCFSRKVFFDRFAAMLSDFFCFFLVFFFLEGMAAVYHLVGGRNAGLDAIRHAWDGY